MIQLYEKTYLIATR